jgi:hypothetical protein
MKTTPSEIMRLKYGTITVVPFAIGARSIELTHIMLIGKSDINSPAKSLVNCDCFLIWDFSELLTFTALCVIYCDVLAI